MKTIGRAECLLVEISDNGSMPRGEGSLEAARNIGDSDKGINGSTGSLVQKAEVSGSIDAGFV